jgi:RimJ/RimL family protein N-acetyltransferase
MPPIFPKEISLKSGEILLIRTAEKRDAQALLDYLNTVGGETNFLTFGAGDFKLTVKEEIQYIESQKKAPNCLLLVAEIDGKIIAVSGLHGIDKPRQKHIGEFGITVRKEHWGKGIGSNLMQNILDWAKASGIIRKVYLKVQTNNDVAIALYKRFGFEEEGLLKRDSCVNGEFYDSYTMGLLVE